MFLPYAYAIAALWFSVFNPQIIDAIPVGNTATKQLLYGIIVVAIWCMLALHALANSTSHE